MCKKYVNLFEILTKGEIEMVIEEKEEKNDFPLISLIVPVYNVEQYLKKCFASIKEQTYKNIEIILVDDGSKDCSGQICDELAATDDRVVVVHKKNGGLSSARNEGIKIAKGEYIGFIDSDDWIDPKMYEVLYLNIVKDNTLISCCGRIDVNEETKIETIGLCPVKEEIINSEECLRRILKWDNIDSSAVDKLFHRSIFEKFKFPIGVISEDVAIMYQIISWSKQISLVPIPMYYYNHRKNSITTSEFNEKKLDVLKHSCDILKFIKEYYPNLEQGALYFRYKQLIYIYDEIINSKAYTKKRYKMILFQIAEEFRKYRKQLNRIYYDSTKMKIKIIVSLYPNVYIILKKVKRCFDEKNSFNI